MRKTRIFYSDNGTLSDLSDTLGDYKAGAITLDINPSQDYLYIGNVAPFNHFFVKMGNPVNNEVGFIKVEYWTGTGWVEAIETIDLTQGFTHSSYISFVPDKNSNWVRQDTHEASGIIGLTSIKIYDYYWARLKFTGGFKDHLELKWFGQKFSDDNDLGAEYPDLVRSATKSAFETGKADYEEQAIRAGEVIVQDLIKHNIIWSKNQVLDREEFKLASVCKTAEIIYNAFGDDYLDQKQQSRQEYDSRFKKIIFSVDRNEDGQLSVGEMQSRMGFVTR